ncbi:hypothetical protein RJ639_020397 [Escallonia herrerae]|uniref:Uncharacterized protein n=1 Tax=Escallonia herrerae TaxID=1293975 RepID=A0AA89AHZ5_9ASTE|nr:hypothetical protein RJ639_020397 [Escallonia herrerae]
MKVTQIKEYAELLHNIDMDNVLSSLVCIKLEVMKLTLDGESFHSTVFAIQLVIGVSTICIVILIAPSLFPPNSSVLHKWPFKAGKNESVTRRFVFHGTALAALRAQAASISHVQYPTSVEAVAALIWSCAIEAISKVTNKGPKQASIFAVPVNLRTRMRQVLPKSSMGNLVWFAFAQHMPDAKLEFPCIVDCIRKVFAKVDNDFIEGIKGKEGYAKVSECLKEYTELLHNIDMDNCLLLTSLRKAGISEIDFGWGKPSWYYFCNPGFQNLVFLMDTRSGDGIEALVSLSGQAMAIFERDPKLLVFASVDPSPL